MLAVVGHAVGVITAQHEAHGGLLVVVVVDEVGHLGIDHAQLGGQHHLTVGDACHRVERYAADGGLYLSLVGIDAGHEALGGDDERDARHLHLGGADGCGEFVLF